MTLKEPKNIKNLTALIKQLLSDFTVSCEKQSIHLVGPQSINTIELLEEQCIQHDIPITMCHRMPNKISGGPILFPLHISSDEQGSKFILGFASSAEQLQRHKKRLDYTKSIDHKLLGREMNLFHFQDESPGIAFFHPRGHKVFLLLEQYLRKSNEHYGCQEIKTPLMAHKVLWERSGHMSQYDSNMYMTSSDDYVVRPMNCPTGMQVFRKMALSHRNLPIRLSEFGIVHRREASGALNGLFRSRSFTQDDCHVFCQESDIKTEVATLLSHCEEVYKDFGFALADIELKLATRPDKYVGSLANWDTAEFYLTDCLKDSGLEWSIAEAQGAFYGPKIELHISDRFDRKWQCGTIQVDFSMAANLDARYTDQEGMLQHPIVIHRAIIGSFERFLGIVMEQSQGLLPTIIAPEHIILCSMSDKFNCHVLNYQKKINDMGLRCEVDTRSMTLQKKIKSALIGRYRFIGVIGQREIDYGTISLREYASNSVLDVKLSDIQKHIV